MCACEIPPKPDHSKVPFEFCSLPSFSSFTKGHKERGFCIFHTWAKILSKKGTSLGTDAIIVRRPQKKGAGRKKYEVQRERSAIFSFEPSPMERKYLNLLFAQTLEGNYTPRGEKHSVFQTTGELECQGSLPHTPGNLGSSINGCPERCFNVNYV